jgi:hypothetical protein
MNDWKKVEKDELDVFIKNYPNQLVKDVTGICDPPMLSYNDFSDGKVWPESIVAKVILNTFYGESDNYYIKEIKRNAIIDGLREEIKDNL